MANTVRSASAERRESLKKAAPSLLRAMRNILDIAADNLLDDADKVVDMRAEAIAAIKEALTK